ncbi:MAG TPA: hypothetical protein VF228_00965 [Iamia sp.]
MSRSRQLSALLVVFCLFLAACGGDSDDPETQPTTTQPSTTTTQSQEEDDEQALRQLAEDWYLAIREIYDEEADLDLAAEYLIDPYLSGFQVQVNEYRAGDETIESSPDSTHDVVDVTVEGDSATVIECVVDADVLKAADGSVISDDVVAKLFSTSAIRTGDEWRLQERTTVDEAEGTVCPQQ